MDLYSSVNVNVGSDHRIAQGPSQASAGRRKVEQVPAAAAGERFAAGPPCFTEAHLQIWISLKIH